MAPAQPAAATDGHHSGSKRSALLAGSARAAGRLIRAFETLGSDDTRKRAEVRRTTGSTWARGASVRRRRRVDPDCAMSVKRAPGWQRAAGTLDGLGRSMALRASHKPRSQWDWRARAHAGLDRAMCATVLPPLRTSSAIEFDEDGCSGRSVIAGRPRLATNPVVRTGMVSWEGGGETNVHAASPSMTP
jgi:hypothetical protein